MSSKLSAQHQNMVLKVAQQYAQLLTAQGCAARVDTVKVLPYGYNIQLSTGKAQLYFSAVKKQYSLTVQHVQQEQEAVLWLLWEQLPVAKKPQVQRPSQLNMADDVVTASSTLSPATASSYVAYVDGSFDVHKHRGSAAWVVLHDGTLDAGGGEPIHQSLEHRNITGELLAAIRVLEYCDEQGIAEITIYHDLEATGYWARGDWKRNKPLTQRFYARVQAAKVRPRFVWVKGHSGVHWNEVVDQLATHALNQNKPVAAQDFVC